MDRQRNGDLLTVGVPEWAAGGAGARAAETLIEIARSINSDLPSDRMLETVVRTTRQLLDADRATILLLDDDGQLGPEVSVARLDDLELWTRFRDMPPIPLSVKPAMRDLLVQGRAIVVPDAEASPLVPREWQRAFGLRSVLIAPLVVMGEPCGALVVDDARPGYCFDDSAVSAAEGIAALAAIALRHARRYTESAQQARALDELLSMASALNCSPGLHRVLQTAVDGFLQVFTGVSCSLTTLVADGGLRCLASRGPGQPEPGLVAGGGPSTADLDAARRRWASEPNAPYVHDAPAAGAGQRGPAPVGGTILLPFTQEDEVRGFARIGLRPGYAPTAEQLRIGVSLAGQAWLAIERAQIALHAQRRAQRIEALYGLAHEIALLPDVRLVIERLAPAVREATGSELIDVLLCDREAARIFCARTPRADIAPVIRRWRRQAAPRPCLADGLYVVPLVVATELIGALRVRAVSPAQLGPDTEDFLLAVASGIADLVHRIVLRAHVEAAERELAVAEERARVTAELYEEVGRLLLTAAARIEPLADRLPDATSRAAVRETQTEIARTGQQLTAGVKTLDILQRHAEDLPGSLRQLVRAWVSASTIDADVRVVGKAYPLTPLAEGALLRVAHEALTRVVRNSCASIVMVHLRYRADSVELVVRDDGVHLGQRATAHARVHPALRAMKTRLGDVGGSLDIKDCQPQGLRLTAVVPTASSRTATATVSAIGSSRALSAITATPDPTTAPRDVDQRPAPAKV